MKNNLALVLSALALTCSLVSTLAFAGTKNDPPGSGDSRRQDKGTALSGLFWFDASDHDLNRQKTLSDEETFLFNQDAHTYNTESSGGTLVERGYTTDSPIGTETDIYRH